MVGTLYAMIHNCTKVGTFHDEVVKTMSVIYVYTIANLCNHMNLNTPDTLAKQWFTKMNICYWKYMKSYKMYLFYTWVVICRPTLDIWIISSGDWRWRHQMETFSALLALCAGNSPVPVNSPHKGQWRGALMFSLIYAWINDWVNNRDWLIDWLIDWFLLYYSDKYRYNIYNNSTISIPSHIGLICHFNIIKESSW